MTQHMNDYFTINYQGMSKKLSIYTSILFIEKLFHVKEVLGVEIIGQNIFMNLNSDNERNLLRGTETTLVFTNTQPSKFLFQGKPWTMLMKLAENDFPFDSIHWTRHTTFNEYSHNNYDFNNTSAKFEAYNSLIISELLILTPYNKYTILELPRQDWPLLRYMKTNTTYSLYVKSGCEHPLGLINSSKIQSNSSIKKLHNNWRINACRKDKFGSFGARIGGFFVFSFDENHGYDDLTNKCSAETCGLGLIDLNYTPLIRAKKSFGIRQAHDREDLDNGMGQYQGEVILFAR